MRLKILFFLFVLFYFFLDYFFSFFKYFSLIKIVSLRKVNINVIIKILINRYLREYKKEVSSFSTSNTTESVKNLYFLTFL